MRAIERLGATLAIGISFLIGSRVRIVEGLHLLLIRLEL